MAPEEPETPKQQPSVKSTQTAEKASPGVKTDSSSQPVNSIINGVDQTKIPELKDGGVVPATPGGRIIKVAEGNQPEIVSPIDKFLNSNSGINNEALNKIVSNTGDTNASLKMLSEAIFKLATVFDKKLTSNNSPIVVNSSSNQKEDSTSASQAAASNQDPIRRVRMQFAY